MLLVLPLAQVVHRRNAIEQGPARMYRNTSETATHPRPS
jgi:hypothetical protein